MPDITFNIQLDGFLTTDGEGVSVQCWGPADVFSGEAVVTWAELVDKEVDSYIVGGQGGRPETMHAEDRAKLARVLAGLEGAAQRLRQRMAAVQEWTGPSQPAPKAPRRKAKAATQLSDAAEAEVKPPAPQR